MATVTDPTIVNVAGYKFVTLDDLARRRRDLRQLCRRLQLKGTILLAEEGINLFVAGQREAVDAFLCQLRTDPAFVDIEVKESFSAEQPFTRMLVRRKNEIIAFGVEQIDPRRHTSARITAQQLRQWLHEGRPVTLLDVRNDYEIELGTFRDAVRIGVDHFRHFPEAARRLPDGLKRQPVVTFCTGGIRCEKAAPYLEQLGFPEVYQLDGGILKYFETCGDEHYEGDCFVFDKRVALAPELTETATTLCYACQAALSEADQQSPRYVPGKSCPHCFRSDRERMAETIERRHAAIADYTDPLPGSEPYENRRPVYVPSDCQGMSLLEFLCALHPHVSRDTWRQDCQQGRLLVGDQPAHAETIVVTGQRYDHVFPDTVEPAVDADIRVVYEDDWLVVVNKPAPLPMHPCGRFNRNSLQQILNHVYRPWKPRVVHRLDANTSGVVVLAKTGQVASLLQTQFVRGSVRKEYLARVAGHPATDDFECEASISDGPAEVGARVVDPGGLPVRTEFHVLRRLGDGSTLVTAIPHTGRTNQIRVHLWHLETPICGDPVYLPGRRLDRAHTLLPEDPPMCLHANRILLHHPASEEAIQFEAAVPAWGD